MKKWIQRKPKTNLNKGVDLLSQLCNIRGIDAKNVDEFLAPSKDVLIPATDMKNAEKASRRIMQAIDNAESIVVSMDNDADGVTSTAIMVRYLQERTGDEVPYIFAERDWGHGIKEQLRMKDSEDANEERNENALHNRNMVKEADLLIIIDSSSNDVGAIEKIVNEYDTDVIILDHHEVEKGNETKLEEMGVILVNPQQRGCRYVNTGISGAGIAWKMVGLVEEMYDDGLVDTDKFIDLAGVGVR